jgi:hypothetical protein
VGLGFEAIEAGYRVFFNTAPNLIAALTKANGEKRLEEKLTSLRADLDLCNPRAELQTRCPRRLADESRVNPATRR